MAVHLKAPQSFDARQALLELDQVAHLEVRDVGDPAEDASARGLQVPPRSLDLGVRHDEARLPRREQGGDGALVGQQARGQSLPGADERQLGADAREALDLGEILDSGRQLLDGAEGEARISDQLLEAHQIDSRLPQAVADLAVATDVAAQGDPAEVVRRHRPTAGVIVRGRAGEADRDAEPEVAGMSRERAVVGGVGGVFILKVGQDKAADVVESQIRERGIRAGAVAREVAAGGI
ncbi:hypothetical protein MPH_05740 [Macrophomina phaseolina MS6]|uniref:Uncharacterized protein n=1 Tax=Macrophomina phaseolina (strain MS6) TaxID=1126212 RepID=K2SJU1_MACPH|nr:hypothetical protein MPH_05740 [Macrophomina phaseolina MS6]